MSDLLTNMPPWPRVVLVGTAALSILILTVRAKRLRFRYGRAEATLETVARADERE